MGGTQQLTGKMNQVKEMANKLKAMQNPNAMLSYMANQNPEVKEFIKVVKRNGGNFEKSFSEYTASKGIEASKANEALSQAKTLFR